MTELSFLQIDAFADRPFSGNPAVVCRPGEPLDPDLMQQIAREMNVSETCLPVTGSAPCALGPFWADRLRKEKLTGYQASDRGGWVYVNVRGNRVEIGGKAVTVAQGTLRV